MNETTILWHQALRVDLMPEDSSMLPVRLVVGPQLVLGRNKEECDMVSWFLPRSEENDRETRKLSQVHALLERERDHFRIRDADSARGTFWNHKPVMVGEGVLAEMGPEGRLGLGKNFQISVEWYLNAGAPCAVLRPLVSEPAFRKCIWMTVTVVGFEVMPGDRLLWLHPAGANGGVDGWFEWRRDALWWRSEGGSGIKLESGVKVNIGGVPVDVRLTAAS